MKAIYKNSIAIIVIFSLTLILILLDQSQEAFENNPHYSICSRFIEFIVTAGLIDNDKSSSNEMGINIIGIV